jgi:hypothetical protein
MTAALSRFAGRELLEFDMAPPVFIRSSGG